MVFILGETILLWSVSFKYGHNASSYSCMHILYGKVTSFH